jgi:hypothetical protein
LKAIKKGDEKAFIEEIKKYEVFGLLNTWRICLLLAIKVTKFCT